MPNEESSALSSLEPSEFLRGEAGGSFFRDLSRKNREKSSLTTSEQKPTIFVGWCQAKNLGFRNDFIMEAIRVEFLRGLQMKGREINGFGGRLVRLRKSCGLTQAQLGDKVGVSERVIAYYENESSQPPGAILADLAKALQVSTDELLGLKKIKKAESPKTARLVNRLRRIEELSPADQRAVLKYLDALLAKQRA